MREGKQEHLHNFEWKDSCEENMADLGVDGRLILKWILN